MMACWLSWNSQLLAQHRSAWTWQASPSGNEWLGANETEHRIFLGLREKRNVSLNNTPLNKVMKEFSKVYGFPILLDEKGLEDETVTAEDPITLNVPEISLRSALRLILDPLNLTFVIRDEVMIITNKRNSANMLCVYDVDSLLPSRAGSKRDLSLGRLIRAIEESITPDTWLNAGGTSSISLVRNRNEQMVWVIAAPFETHLEIQSLLNTLALQGDKAMSKPAYYIPGYGNHSQGSSVRSSRISRSNLGDR
jgi:hypothetical protein